MRSIIAAAALTLCASASFGQDTQNPPATPPTQTPAPAAGGMPSEPLPPPPELDAPDQAVQSEPDDRGGGQIMHHRGGARGGRAAHFSIETGGAKIRVRCGADQSSTECADTLMQLLDRVQQSDDDDGYRNRRDWDRGRNRWDRDGDRGRYGDRERRWRD